MSATETIDVKDVFRMTQRDGSAPAFSDCMVVAINVVADETRVTLARPYLLEDGEQGKEIFSLDAKRLSPQAHPLTGTGPYWVKVAP